VHRHRDRQGCIDPRQFFDDERVGDRIDVGPAVFDGDHRTHEAHAAELLQQVGGKVAVTVPRRRAGADLVLREIANGAPDQFLVFSEFETQPPPPKILPFRWGVILS